MNELVMPGDIRVALSHAAAYGLAAILDDAGWPGVAIYWSGLLNSRARIITAGREPEEAAEAVLAHARHHADRTNWTAQTTTGGSGLLSPRIAAPSNSSGWRELAALRNAAIDEVIASRRWLDLRLIGALGEPAYWRFDRQGGSRPDEGASRWEMKTRNRGEDFVRHRLRKLAETVAARDRVAVLAGLTGRTVVDEAGKGEPESRTATGLAAPGPVDNVLAWCGLWGLSQLPLIPRLTQRSETAGYGSLRGPGGRHEWFHLPVAARPITLARLRSLIVSAQLPILGHAEQLGDGHDRLEFERARSWLAARGVGAVVTFPIWVSDNPNAPERRALLGSITPTS